MPILVLALAMPMAHEQAHPDLRLGDTFSRFSPAVDPHFSYRAENVSPRSQGSVRSWASEDNPGRPRLRVRQPRSRPVGLCQGRHAQLLAAWEADRHAFIAAPSGRFRSECLNTHWFLTLADAAEKMEAWVKSTTRIGHTGPSATSSQSCCKIPAERPATAVIEGRKL